MRLGADTSGQEGGQGLGHEEQQTVADRRFGLGGHSAQDGSDEAARIKQAVADRVPQGRPDDRSGDGCVDRADVGQSDVGGALIQTRDRVGDLVVVDDDEVNEGSTTRNGEHSLGVDGCVLGVDAHVENMGALEGTVGCTPGRDGHTVGTQDTAACLATLMESEVRDCADGVGFPRGRQRRRAGSIQPGVLPRTQLLVGSLLECLKQVTQAGRTEAMLVEVASGTLVEGILSNPRDQLLEDGGPLGVGDAIEVGLSGGHVRDVGGDRVCRRHLVLRVGPDLSVHREVRPLPRVLGRCRDCAGPLVLCERLLEPQVVPPCWGGQVTEPHVAHLVQGRVRATLTFGEGRRGAGDVGLVEGNAAGVLHGTQVVFGHVDLVVGTPGESDAVALVEEAQARACHLKDVLGVEVARERASAGQAQGQLDVPAVARATAPRGTLDDRPGTRDNCGDVAGQRGCRGKIAARHPLGDGLAADLDAVGEDDPILGRDDVEGPRRLNVWLVDARPRAVGVVGFELRVEVDLPVFGIRIAVQAFTAARVAGERAHLKGDGLPHWQAGHPDTVFVILEGVFRSVE